MENPGFNEAYLQALKEKRHYDAYKQAVEEGVAIPLKYLKVLFFGPPRTGKTSMRRRLVGEILNLTGKSVQPSTGIADIHDVIVTSTAVITECNWSSVKVLFDKEKSTHEKVLDKELQILYQFIHGTVPLIERRSPVPNEQEPQDHFTKEQSSARIDEESPTLGDPQDVSSAGELGKKLSTEEMEEIDKVYDAFIKAMRTPGQEQLKVLLKETILMNMVDTGGQPAFLEMLPALTIGPALYLIFFSLEQELKTRYPVKYGTDKKNVLLDDSYTNEEVIFQALSSIACFSYTAPDMPNPAVLKTTHNDLPNPSCAAMLIGTFKDKLGNDPKTVEAKIKTKDAELQETLNEIVETDPFDSVKNFLQFYSGDQLMLAVDNMTGDAVELTEDRKRLKDVIDQMFLGNERNDKLQIPASWLMFNIFLRKMGKRTLSLLQCHEIGNRLKVKNTDAALWFLHHYVGTLMHFPDIEEIKDIVICDVQVVFDSVTDLILNSFKLDLVSKQVCDKFKNAGQFNFTDIQNIAAKNLKNDSLSLQELVKLLEYLNIIAPISCSVPPSDVHQAMKLPLNPGQSGKHQEEKPGDSNPQSDTPQKVYFMPALLKHATEEELLMKRNPTDPVPLMIHFKCGFVPVGVFCAKIASLVAQEVTLGWTLQKAADDCKLSKNKATFLIEYEYYVTLISKPKHIEVHITTSEEKICSHVREAICNTLDQVMSKMKYKGRISSRSDQKLYELGFKCPEHPDEDHLVIIKPIKRELKASSHSGKLNYGEDESKLVCLRTRRKAKDLCQSFEQQSRVWFCEVSQFKSPVPIIGFILNLRCLLYRLQ